MSKESVLAPAVTLRVAKQIKIDDDQVEDIVKNLGIALKLKTTVIDEIVNGMASSQKPVDLMCDLLNKWVDFNGSNEESATKLREILRSKGYTQAADVLANKEEKKPVSRGCNHSHDPRENSSTSDKIITVVTTLVVALIAIIYAHYKNFKV